MEDSTALSRRVLEEVQCLALIALVWMEISLVAQVQRICLANETWVWLGEPMQEGGNPPHSCLENPLGTEEPVATVQATKESDVTERLLCTGSKHTERESLCKWPVPGYPAQLGP